MKKLRYTQEQIDFILARAKKPWPVDSIRFLEQIAVDFSEKFGRKSSYSRIRHFLARYNIRTDKGFFRYTQEQIDFILARADAPASVIAAAFSERFGIPRSVDVILTFFHRRGIRRGSHNCKRFKPGESWNRCPVGTESNRIVYRRNKKSNPTFSKYIKVAEPDIWQLKHVAIWEAAHGPLPKGCYVTFADGNNENYALDNLLKVSRGELLEMQRNEMIFEDGNLTKSAHLTVKLSIAANKKKKLLKRRSDSGAR